MKAQVFHTPREEYEYPSEEYFANEKKLPRDQVEQLERLSQTLYDIDKLIAHAGLLLNESQPYFAGKIGLRWWTTGGKIRPVLVQWRWATSKSQTAKLFASPIEEKTAYKHVRNLGDFKKFHEQTRTILRTLVELLGERKAIRKTLENTKRMYTFALLKNARLTEIRTTLRSVGSSFAQDQQ